MIRKSTNKDMKRLNTFRMKVKAALYLEYDDPGDLAALDWDALPAPVRQIGAGSNLLFCGDWHGTLMHSAIKGINVIGEMTRGDDVFVRAGSGVSLDELCHWAARKKFWGPENLSGIPGTVGASVVQNVGAYGVEAGDLVDSVECFDMERREFVRLSAVDCAFAYRDSFFKRNPLRYIVLYVVYHFRTDFRPNLEYGNLKAEVERNVELSNPSSDPYGPVFNNLFVPSMPLTPMLVRDTVKCIRESKLPDPNKIGSAGSFFKNPVVDADFFEELRQKIGRDDIPHYDLPDGKVKIPAAWLIDSCGLKGASCGGAAVWEKQPLVIVNASGKASWKDVLEMERRIVEEVNDRYGVKLLPEVEHCYES